MKKLITIAIVLLMAGVAYAATDNEPIATSVNVTSQFYINVSAAVANFGNVAQGGSAAAPISIGVTCYSNNGLPWTVNVAGAALTHTDLVTTIPSNPNLQLYGFKTGGLGAISTLPTNFAVAQPLPAVAAKIYDGSSTSGGATWNLELPAMPVPANQKAGAYSTTITLTMIE